MTQVRLNLKGFAQLNNALKQYDINVEKRVNAQIQKSTLNVESGAKQRAPVRTGRLRSSIRSIFGKLRGQVFTNVIYSKYVEYGTSRMSAQPFLFPAWEEERPKLIQEIRKILAASILSK